MEYIYILISVILFISMFVYLKIADKYNIIDKPNHRSTHTQITLRGGGIIFPISFILFCLFNLNDTINHYWSFGLGLLVICTVSFIDDIKPLSNRIRLSVHLISVIFLLYFTGAFSLMPYSVWPILFILIIGTLNAYNFMDGINGITGLYSLSVLASLFYVNQNIIQFAAPGFIIYPALACLVFLFFNLRHKARCFMGDIGSMGIAFWIIALLGLLIVKTGELKWILFFAVYGVEVIATILERIQLKENIFEAHRRHLYQLFANEKKVPHRLISAGYAGVQVLINVFVVKSPLSDPMQFGIVLVPLVVIYFYIKFAVKKQIARKVKSSRYYKQA